MQFKKKIVSAERESLRGDRGVWDDGKPEAASAGDDGVWRNRSWPEGALVPHSPHYCCILRMMSAEMGGWKLMVWWRRP